MAGRVTLEVSTSETRRVNRNIRRFGSRYENAVRNLLIMTAEDISSDAKRNLRENDSVATGELRDSIGVDRQTGREFLVDIVADATYAGVVEFGRHAGSMPPIEPILNWIRLKGIGGGCSESEQRSIAFAIAREIERNGTEPKPFMRPAFTKNIRAFNRNLRNLARNASRFVRR